MVIGSELWQDEDFITLLDGDIYIFQIAFLDLAEGAITIQLWNAGIAGFLDKAAGQIDAIGHSGFVVD